MFCFVLLFLSLLLIWFAIQSVRLNMQKKNYKSHHKHAFTQVKFTDSKHSNTKQNRICDQFTFLRNEQIFQVFHIANCSLKMFKNGNTNREQRTKKLYQVNTTQNLCTMKYTNNWIENSIRTTTRTHKKWNNSVQRVITKTTG